MCVREKREREGREGRESKRVCVERESKRDIKKREREIVKEGRTVCKRERGNGRNRESKKVCARVRGKVMM